MRRTDKARIADSPSWRGPSGPAVRTLPTRSIALLEEYTSTSLHIDPWQYLEYFCNGCLLRMNWRTPEWAGREPGFLEADYKRLRDDELGRLGDGLGHMADAKHILDSLVLNDEFIDFLTLPAYGHLD